MISNWAIVQSDNVVWGVTLWDGKNGWQPPEGTTVVKVPKDVPAGPGWHYINGKFVDNRPQPETDLADV
jgi:hypothetical protein